MKAISRFFTVLMFVFLYAPLAVMIFFSFNSSKSTYNFEGFSLKWYEELFSSGTTMTALKNTLILAILSAIIATLLGTLAAVGIFNMRNRVAKSGIMTVTNIPMMNPDVVTGVSMMLLFVFIGQALKSSSYLNFYTILIAHITFNLPYVILNVLPKLRQTDKHLAEAAQDLGCTPSSAFFKVVLPNISSGIVSGFIMSFTLSLDDFVISYFTNGTGFQTLPLLIYNKTTKKTVKPDIYALSSVIFITVLVLLIIVNLVQAKSDNKGNSGNGALAKISGKISDAFDRLFTTRKAKVSVMCVVLCIFIALGGIGFKMLDKASGKYDELFSSLEGTYTREFEGTELNIYNWGEYISDGSEGTLDVIDAFSELTGIDVNYDTFDSNESMYSKLKSGAVSYDIIIPSDYMIARMINDGMLNELDYSKISNYKYIDERYTKQYYDKDEKYTVPYSVGMVGMIYNTTMVDEDDVGSWDIMWNEKYKGDILTFNNPRDAFAIAQFLLGQSVNTTDKSDWETAAKKLTDQNDLLQARVMDEVFNKMGGSNAAIAPYYAGDCITMMEENEDLAFVYPKEGVNIFIDAICVPSCVKNYDAAMMFINFMCETQIALSNAEYIRYASPNTSVVNNDNYSLKGSEILYPKNQDSIKCEYFYDLPDDVRSYYEKLWEQVLMNK